MINNLISNLRYSKNFKGTFAEKNAIFFKLNKLLLKKMLFKKKNCEVNESIFHYKVIGYNYNTIDSLFKEVFVLNEYYFQPATNNPIIVDCGANIGMSVLYFKKLFPDSKIMAFEANPHAFKLLDKNIKVNKIKNVELHNVALYDKETEMAFYIGDHVGTLVGSIRADRGGQAQLKVPAQKLSRYLEKIETVDLIKMDVEGAELNIIHDLCESSALNKAKEYIIEYHHNINYDKSKLSSFLQKFESSGFSYNIKASFVEINSFQDILIHFYKK